MTLEEAKEILKDYIQPDGRLFWKPYACLQYLDWSVKSMDATLDGEFSADTLEAISIIMRQK